MVVFTCNHCGESLKKQAVEKHYYTKCRGAPKNVSCMDCQKDFHNEDFVAHIKCISEIQKYSGKDYVHKEAANSNAKKQESWMDIVRSILENSEYKLDAQTRGAFERLQTMDNVPRKKAKFINFTNNCLKMYKKIGDKVWNVLEKELEKMKLARAEETARLKAAQEAAKKAKKENNGQAKEEKSSEDEPPKKKKKKNQDTEVAEAQENEDTPVSKKKNKKSKDLAEDENSLPNGTESLTNGDTDSKKKKKKSKASEEDAAGQENETEALTNGSSAESKKKKKASKTTEETIEEQANDETLIDSDEFQWSSVIERLVAKHPDGIPLTKLQNKLLKKYLVKLSLEALDEKQQKKFERKFSKNLKKSPSVQVEGELVKSC